LIEAIPFPDWHWAPYAWLRQLRPCLWTESVAQMQFVIDTPYGQL
jgi:hypothetical protein